MKTLIEGKVLDTLDVLVDVFRNDRGELVLRKWSCSGFQDYRFGREESRQLWLRIGQEMGFEQ